MTTSTTETIKTQADSNLKMLGTSPYPAALFGGLLLLKGAVFPDVSVATATKAPGKPVKEKAWMVRPTRASCFTFGPASLIGAYMIHDQDAVNGAGFAFAWSTLYLVVNGKQAVTGLFHFRLPPAILGALALGNAGWYGKEYFQATTFG
ncbi:hypothetical protein DICA0_C09714 [Diutina catenulata]